MHLYRTRVYRDFTTKYDGITYSWRPVFVILHSSCGECAKNLCVLTYGHKKIPASAFACAGICRE